MVHLAFDMDGTLGNFSAIFPILHIFDSERKRPEIIENELHVAYALLVKKIAKNEELGIFRPGIFNTFKQIAKLKSSGKVQKVIIYSNNRSKSLVTFVKNVIERVVKAPLFDGAYHYTHKDRIVLPKEENPGPNKTWQELKKLLDVPNLIPHNVMFFDDLNHADLKHTLKTNYIHVTPYAYRVKVKEVHAIYYDVLKASNLINEPGFFKHIGKENVGAHIRDLKKSIMDMNSTQYKPHDDESKKMLLSIKARIQNGGTRKCVRNKTTNRKTMWATY